MEMDRGIYRSGTYRIRKFETKNHGDTVFASLLIKLPKYNNNSLVRTTGR